MKIWKTLKINKKITKQDLEKAGINVSSYAADILEKVEFKKETVDLVKITVNELGFKNYATTEQIYAKAKELGLELCPAAVGPALRLEYKDQPKGEWLFIGMETIADRSGDPRVFRLGRHVDGLWLRNHWANPTDQWNPGNEFVFRLRKSLGNSETSSEEGQTHSQQDNCGDINHNEWCGGCGKLLQPHNPTFILSDWDGHSYHCTCSKWPKNQVLSIG